MRIFCILSDEMRNCRAFSSHGLTIQETEGKRKQRGGIVISNKLEVVKKDEKCAYSGRKIVTKETQEGC
ncbi:MAG: hypothetical protein PUJ93_07960, partial [Oscillospiraceae bacterium]|nr:hypothetical protein [Oscillospiraceae bacterium]MDY5735136.1 hypothetical protein [Oscillospiraceae bacterium]